jgi:predicted HicB family RNase H-like nuclease
MYEIKQENYDEINESFSEILSKIKDIKSIEIKGKTYEIEFFLGCDYKMLRILYGQKAANSNEGCLWCDINLKNEIDTSDTWQITRTLKDKHTHLPPIIDFIEFKNCVVDLLHLFLRISEHLYNLLYFKLTRLDNNNGSDIDQRPLLKKFLNFLIEKCKINNAYYSSPKNAEKKIMLRRISGKEWEKIYENIFESFFVEENVINKKGENQLKMIEKKRNFTFLYPDIIDEPANFKLEDLTWYKFFEIYNEINSYHNKNKKERKSVKRLKDELKNWLEDYLEICEKENGDRKIAPYDHIFTSHVGEMLETYGNLNIFSTQNLEKLNEFCKTYYHSCTNKHSKDKSYLKQLLNKRIRTEFFKLDGDLSEFYLNEEDEENEDENENEAD